MRIIAGRHRGRTILAPDSATTRPITDRAKQSLFDILAPRIEDAVIFDLFAGTGSMGLESLSRGAKSAIFFERDRSAVIRLRKNLAALGETAKATIIDNDIFGVFGNHAHPLLQTIRAKRSDIIFLDPPYRFVIEKRTDMQSLARRLAADYIAPGALLVFRHDRGDRLDLPGFLAIDQRTFGSMAIDLLQPVAMAADEVPT